MKVFLDDERATPEGWTRVFWPAEAIALLPTGEVTEISLDHDLGDALEAQDMTCSSGLRSRLRSIASPLPSYEFTLQMCPHDRRCS